MTTYSTDLRERVVRAYEKGDGSIRQLARRYEVSKNTVDFIGNRRGNIKKMTFFLYPFLIRLTRH